MYNVVLKCPLNTLARYLFKHQTKGELTEKKHVTFFVFSIQIYEFL